MCQLLFKKIRLSNLTLSAIEIIKKNTLHTLIITTATVCTNQGLMKCIDTFHRASIQNNRQFGYFPLNQGVLADKSLALKPALACPPLRLSIEVIPHLSFSL